jgi:UDP-glucose 4-epimerase
MNLAFGTRTDLLSLIELLEREFGCELKRDHLPARVGDVPHSQADSSKLRAAFPVVKPTPLGAGLVETVRWMRAVHPT